MKAIVKLAAWAGVFGLLIGGASIEAATLDFNVSTGDWNTAASWNPAQVPTSNDTANINNGGTVTISTVATGNTVNVGTAGSGNAQIVDGAALDLAYGFNIGSSALQSGGNVAAWGSAYHRFSLTGSGSYTQEAGVVRAKEELIIGSGATAFQTLTYVLVNGTLEQTANIYVGRGAGVGRFIQYGGTLAATVGTLYVGFDTTREGFFYQYGGTNYCSSLVMPRGCPHGVYVITNGELNVGGSIWLGWHGAYLGEMQVSGSAKVVTPAIFLGRSESVGNTGIWTQVGGTVTASTELNLGGHPAYGSNGVGTYALGGGTLTTPSLNLGHGATSQGFFTQTGGVLNATAIAVGEYATGTGTFHVVGMAPQVRANSYTQTSRGTTELTLDWGGGMRPIAVTNTATLAGTLTIGRTNNVKFEPGTVVTVMTYSAKSGAFAQTNLLNGLDCRVNVLTNMITLDNLSPRLNRGMIMSVR